ncbi:MAG: hypothetical protein ACKO0Z_10880 [Betaproteobacteria bacterium]
MKSGKGSLLAVAAFAAATFISTNTANAAPAANQAQEQATPQKAAKQPGNREEKGRAGGTQPSNPSQLKIGSVQDLCRIREREILFHASMALSQTTNALKEADPERKAALLNELNTTKSLAADVESSWQRLSCYMLLYGSPVMGGGR